MGTVLDCVTVGFLGDHNFAGQCQLTFTGRKEKDFRFGRTSLDRLEFKRLRGELLVRLKDRCCLMYSQINYFPMFEELKYSSMGQLYKRTKAGLEKEDS